MLLGFNPSGILVFNQVQARKEIHSRCGWKAITNICSNVSNGHIPFLYLT